MESQVKEMRGTLEEIYNSQLQLVNQSNQVALAELRDSLDKEHNDEINKLGQEWDRAFEDLKQDYDRELRESKLGDSLGESLLRVVWQCVIYIAFWSVKFTLVVLVLVCLIVLSLCVCQSSVISVLEFVSLLFGFFLSFLLSFISFPLPFAFEKGIH